MAEGTTGLLAFWVGGAGAPPATGGDAGPRSLLAFWMGGAASYGGAEPPAPAPSPSASGPGPFRRPVDLRVRRSAAEEDDLLMAMAAQLIASGKIH